MIRNDRDFAQHIDYIHLNPVKHGWVDRVRDWPYSSFHAFVRRGIYPINPATIYVVSRASGVRCIKAQFAGNRCSLVKRWNAETEHA